MDGYTGRSRSCVYCKLVVSTIIAPYVWTVEGLLIVLKGGAMGVSPDIMSFTSVTVKRWQGSTHRGMDVIQSVHLPVNNNLKSR